MVLAAAAVGNEAEVVFFAVDVVADPVAADGFLATRDLDAIDLDLALTVDISITFSSLFALPVRRTIEAMVSLMR